MRSRAASIWRGIALGALWTFAFVGVASLVEVLAGIPNPAYRLFEWASRVLPGAIVTFAIDLVVQLVRFLGAASTADAAKAIEHAMAVILAVALGGLAGGCIAVLVRRGFGALRVGPAAGTLALVLYLAIVARPSDLDAAMLVTTALAFVGWGAATGASIHATRATLTGEPVSAQRRRVLFVISAAAAATGAVAFGVARLFVQRRGRVTRTSSIEGEAALTSGPAASPSPESLAARIAPVPGTRPELTDNADFYRVDINLTPPQLYSDRWRLDAGGLVERPRVLTLDELRARPAVSQIITLECISNPVGGDLIGTSRWTGIRLADFLDELGVRPEARAVAFEAADGFHETATLDDARDPRALLVYAMNGEPLTAEHGFPLRLYLPDRHGMKLPKWIQRIELVAKPRPGYWVERGWSQTAIPHTTSVIDTVRATGDDAQRRLSVGGIAYAGARGIRRVEVQIDGGAWQEAQLRAPPLGPLTWVQWRLDVPYRPGRHTFRVRAYDGSGALQESTVRSPHPDGATGLHTKKAEA